MKVANIKNFQEIYFKEYWEEISEEQATNLWNKLLTFMNFILISKNESDDKK